LALALLLGASLRLFGLPRQVLVGDEVHAVAAALSMTIPEMATRWVLKGSDYSIPLGMTFRFLMDRGIEPSEMALRAPAIAAGTALILLVPLALLRVLGPLRACILALLLAVSPPLVLFSRVVRSYMPMVLVATLALLSFERWYRGEGRRRLFGALYVLLATMSLFLHLGSATFVLAPFVFAFADLAIRRADRAQWLRLAWLAGATAVAVASLLLPGHQSLLWIWETRGHSSFPTGTTFLETARLHVGSSSTAVGALVALVAGRGLAVLIREHRGFAALTATVVLLHLGALLLLAPHGSAQPTILQRYTLVLLPLVLAWVAIGLGTPSVWHRSPLEPWLRLGLGAAVVGVVVATGPLASRTFRHTSFAHLLLFYYATDLEGRAAEAPVPTFYRSLEPGAGAIVEVPWHPTVFTLRSYAYQPHHGRDVITVLGPASSLDDERLGLRNTVRPEEIPSALGRAEYVAIHREPTRAELEVPAITAHHAATIRRNPRLGKLHEALSLRTERRLRRAWGAPDHGDEALRVWSTESRPGLPGA